MATFNTPLVTTQGLALLKAEIAGNDSVTFTKIVFSSDDYSQTADSAVQALTGLSSLDLTAPAKSFTDVNGNLKIRAVANNQNTTSAFYVKSYGLYGTNKAGNEMLIAVATSQNANFIPAYNNKQTNQVAYTFNIAISSTNNITLSSSTDVSVTQADLAGINNAVNSNASSLTAVQSAFNSSVGSAFSSNSSSMSSAFSSNAAAFNNAFSSNVSSVNSAFSSNASSMSNAFSSNASSMNSAFSANSSNTSSYVSSATNSLSSYVSSNVGGMQSQVTNNSNSISNNANNINSLQSSVATNSANISSLQSSVANNSSAIASNSSSLATQISNANNSINANSSNVSNLQSSVAANSTAISSNATSLSNAVNSVSSSNSAVNSSVASAISNTQSSVTSNATQISSLKNSDSKSLKYYGTYDLGDMKGALIYPPSNNPLSQNDGYIFVKFTNSYPGLSGRGLLERKSNINDTNQQSSVIDVQYKFVDTGNNQVWTWTSGIFGIALVQRLANTADINQLTSTITALQNQVSTLQNNSLQNQGTWQGYYWDFSGNHPDGIYSINQNINALNKPGDGFFGPIPAFTGYGTATLTTSANGLDRFIVIQDNLNHMFRNHFFVGSQQFSGWIQY